MKIVQCLCDLTVRHIAGEGVIALLGLVRAHVTDTSGRLERALRRSSDRAWKALEIALGGQSRWGKVLSRFVQDDVQEVSTQLRTFLDSFPLEELSQSTEGRELCLQELRDARKAGLLLGGDIDLASATDQAQKWAQMEDPGARQQAEWEQLYWIIQQLEAAKYSHLAGLLKQKQIGGMPFIVVAARYFFQREIEEDSRLGQAILFRQLEGLSLAQSTGLRNLEVSLNKHGGRLNQLLSEIKKTHDAVLDLDREMRKRLKELSEQQKQLFAPLYQAVQQLLEQQQLTRRPLRFADSQSISSDYDRDRARSILARCRDLPPEERQKIPALLNAVGKLGFAINELPEARALFEDVAAVTADQQARGEVRYNTYQVALGQQDWDSALGALKEAAELDPEQFSPFPLSEYEPERILGAGGFGVTFLCRSKLIDARVAIKTLRAEMVEDYAQTVKKEAQALQSVHHPGVIRFQHFHFADKRQTRPYLVMEYFEGETLERYVKDHGPVDQNDFKQLGAKIAEALQAAHEKGIIHRDVKPANILLRRNGLDWEIRLIDFGLAKVKLAVSDASNTVSQAGSITGTLDYAAPEQLGKIFGAPVGPPADVYGFARTCCFALFGTPTPLAQHWDQLTNSYRDWINRCLIEDPAQRPGDFQQVIKQISRGRIKSKGKPKKAKRPPKPLKKLVVLRGLRLQTSYPLQEGENVLGRTGGVGVTIDLAEQENVQRAFISPRHAIISLEEEKLTIRDLQSTHGTFVNRTRLQPDMLYALPEKAVIQIGSVQLQYLAD